MDQICTHDVQQINSRLVHAIVVGTLPDNTEQDWFYGEIFPWWVWLATTGSFRDAVGGGIFSFTVKVTSGKVQIGFRCTERVYGITWNGKNKKAIVLKID